MIATAPEAQLIEIEPRVRLSVVDQCDRFDGRMHLKIG